jgi:putative Holliday junction resolvase
VVTLVSGGRAVGIDLGSRRIGVAVSNPGRTLASPRTTLARSGDPERDRRALVDLVVEEEATVVIVGLPLSLDGSRGRAAVQAEVEADALRPLFGSHGIEMELFDERLTTVTAHQSLGAGGKNSRARRKVIDQSAATVMLQAWLEAQRDSG